MRTTFCLAIAFTVMNSFILSDAWTQERYQEPPQSVVDLIDAETEPSVDFSPDSQWMMMVERDAMPSIADVSRRMLRLAGLRIDPAANGRFQTGYNKGLSFRSLDGKTHQQLELPEGGKLSAVTWSHDSQSFAYTVVTDRGTQLWGGRVDQAPKMLAEQISTVMDGLTWMPDGQTILCQLVPEDRGQEPPKPVEPSGPNVQESSGQLSPTRTYQDLLANAYDEALFEYYATNQLALVGLDGNIKRLGAPAIYSSASPAPDGQHLLVSIVGKPFSYLMTYRSFPHDIQVWQIQEGQADDPTNNVTVIKVVANVPMAENIPIEGVRTGPRSVDWAASEPATLMWFEALDGGDPNREADHRDQLFSLGAPFDAEPTPVVKLENRAFGISYMSDPSVIMTTEYDRDRRWVTSLMHDLKAPGTTPKTMMDRSIRDRYGDPGGIATVRNSTGHSVARQDGDWVYRIGAGASPKGNLPFLDRQNLKDADAKPERLWRCSEGTFESAVAFISTSADQSPVVITRMETTTTTPNYYVRDLNRNTAEALTDFKDPQPQIRGIKKQLVTYERADGVPLSATLYLPADYQEGTRLPLIVWAYPREFNDVRTAAQISGSPSRFTQMRSITHLTLLTQGYAIMDGATMPVIGDPKTMNDTFIDQIVGAAQAAIDKAVEMGVADRERVGVGGHSYGAFMTANLLAHCNLFKAGVARSGAYNRTLTPFGFQSERRPFWEAKDVYFAISPFMHANKIKEPILLIHGENDNNSGTFPMQSRRMYQAIKGNGGTVRLVMLPNESHGYRARESVLHTQAEMIDWFDKYVKNSSATSH